MNLVWYDAKKDELFASWLLDGGFYALSFRPEWWDENTHIELIGKI